MWTCPYCHQKFVYQNSQHSCNERDLDDFLEGKPAEMVALFWHFINEYLKLGTFVLHPAKSRIAFAARIRFGYIHRIGQRFVDVVLTFREAHENNLCFYRIGEVPGGKYFQHYLRLERPEDINEEVRKFMKLALDDGS
jgi:hypothetical protein